ncbi:hypothetical protein D922_04464 [Enterococcus faecalis 06-MB-DW-09]|nr:hypothetical protein D922_04464 [Enterococcus faecalis 06-MB-DW-09]
MNKKIQELVAQLHEECHKEETSFLCTIQKNGAAETIACGNLPELGMCLAAEERNLDQKLPIPTKVLRSAAIAAMESVSGEKQSTSNHTFVVNDLKDIPDILDRITRGEFE